MTTVFSCFLCSQPGITRRCRRLASGNTAFFYVAHASAGPFRLCTKSVRDFGVAVRHRRLLQAIKQEVISKAKGGMPERLARIFAHAVHEVPARFRQTPRDIGLSFAATVPAKYWIGRELLTPRYSAERMEAGLAAFQALCRARDQVYRGRSNRYSLYMFSSPMEMEAAWTQLRQEYVRIWSEAGWDRRTGLQIVKKTIVEGAEVEALGLLVHPRYKQVLFFSCCLSEMTLAASVIGRSP